VVATAAMAMVITVRHSVIEDEEEFDDCGFYFVDDASY